MTDRTSMLAAILHDPQDDTPRLIYSDWLDEAGEADRAEFVRLQVELARSARPCPQGIANAEVGYRQNPHKCFMCSDTGGMIYDYDNPKELRRRERELWPPIRKELSGHFGLILLAKHYEGNTPAHDHAWAVSSRGFIASLTISWSDFLRHHERLFWSPGQIEWNCPECGSWSRSRGKIEGYPTCKTCKGAGHIPRPLTDELAATCQPLEWCNLTDWPDTSLEHHLQPVRMGEHFSTGLDWFETRMSSGTVRFDRVKCPKCETVGGLIDPNLPCRCKGRPLNVWTCPAWPTLRFVMPESGRPMSGTGGRAYIGDNPNPVAVVSWSIQEGRPR